eukprot:3407269-Rhodomonas_salina.1
MRRAVRAKAVQRVISTATDDTCPRSLDRLPAMRILVLEPQQQQQQQQQQQIGGAYKSGFKRVQFAEVDAARAIDVEVVERRLQLLRCHPPKPVSIVQALGFRVEGIGSRV